jgi:DDE family transposase
MPFDTLRLRLVKLAVRVVDLKRQIKLHLPTSTPDQTIFTLVLGRLPLHPQPWRWDGSGAGFRPLTLLGDDLRLRSPARERFRCRIARGS